MFSVKQKREISNKVQEALRETNHPELPQKEIKFMLHVNGAETWSFADIRNNNAVPDPGVNPFNKIMAGLELEGEESPGSGPRADDSKKTDVERPA